MDEPREEGQGQEGAQQPPAEGSVHEAKEEAERPVGVAADQTEPPVGSGKAE